MKMQSLDQSSFSRPSHQRLKSKGRCLQKSLGAALLGSNGAKSSASPTKFGSSKLLDPNSAERPNFLQRPIILIYFLSPKASPLDIRRNHTDGNQLTPLCHWCVGCPKPITTHRCESLYLPMWLCPYIVWSGKVMLLLSTWAQCEL